MSCLDDQALAALALGDPGATGKDHLAGCAACAARLARMQRLLALGDAAHRPFPIGRLVLDGEPPARPLFWRRFIMDRRTWAAAGIAAALALWFTLASAPLALADVLKAFKEADGFICEMTALKEGKPVETGKGLVVRFAWAAPGSMRSEMIVEGKPQGVAVKPHDKAGIIIDHQDKTFFRAEKPGAQESVLLRIFGSLAGDVAGDAKPSGHDEIGGAKVPRFDLKLEQDKFVWHYRLWADPKTKRPVRVEAAMAPGAKPDDKGVISMRLEKFEWGKKAAGSFDATPPKGYKDATPKADTSVDSAKKIAAGLKAFKAAKGHYPKSEPFDAVAAAKELGDKPDVKAVEGLVLLGVLQAVSKEAIYRGKSVGPDDKDKVLFRWKGEDGKFQVVYGDLRTESVDAKKLKELEK